MGAFFTTDADLVIRSWDPPMVELTGRPPGEVLGRSLDDVASLTKRRLLGRFRNVVENGAVEILAPALHGYLIACEPRQPSRSFEHMQQHVTLRPVTSGGTIVGIRVELEDVTARMERERRLTQQLRDGDESVRLRAAEELAANAGGAASLATAFGDDSWRVRSAAVAGFADRADEDVIVALTAALRDQHRDLSVLNSALSALAIAGGDVVHELVRLLHDPDPDLRIYVALALGHLGDARAVRPLIAALNDPVDNVRFHAVEALGRLRAEEAAEPLTELVEERNFFLAFAGLDALAAIGDGAVAPRLMALLEDESLRPAVIDTLGRLGEEEAIAPLVAALTDPALDVMATARAIAAVHDRFEDWYGEGDLIRELARRLVTEDGGRRLAAALAGRRGRDVRDAALVLGWLSGDYVDEALVQALAPAEDRAPLIDALVQRGADAVPALVAQLHDEGAADRRTIAAALGRIGSAAAVPALIELLHDAQADVVIVAAHALGGRGDERAFEPLLALLDDARPAVRHAAVAALNSLGHPALPGRTGQLLQDASPRLRESGARIAGYFGYPQCIDAMLQLCADANDSVRRAALEHLAYLPDERVLPTLRNAMQQGDPPTRAAVARALGQIDSAPSVALLLELLRDEDGWVRYQAARAAGTSHQPELVLTLCTLVAGDPHPPVRIAAIDALARIGDRAATRFLTNEVEGSDRDIAIAAINALGRIGDHASRGTLVDALAARDGELRRAALEAVARAGLTGSVAGHLHDAAVSRSDAGFAMAVIDTLGDSDAAESFTALLRITAHPTRRHAAVAAMARMAERNPDILAGGLREPSAAARRAVVEAWGRSRNGAAARHLAGALGDADSSVRTAAAAALARLDLRAAEGRLREIARSPIVRQQARIRETREG